MYNEKVFTVIFQLCSSDENENKYDSEGEIEVGKIPPISLVNNNVNNTTSGHSTSASNTPTRSKNPVKKIDLGAAANYGKDPSVSDDIVSLAAIVSFSEICNNILKIIDNRENIRGLFMSLPQ